MATYRFPRKYIRTKLIASFLLWFCSSNVFASSLRTCLDYPPKIRDSAGKMQWNGDNLEFLDTLVRSMGFKLDVRIRAPFARCLKLMQNGEVDIMAGLVFEQQRTSYMNLVPYKHRNPLVMYVAAQSQIANVNPPPINAIFGYQREFVLPKSLTINIPTSQWVALPNIENGLQMVIKGHLTGMLATVQTGELIIEQSRVIQAGELRAVELPNDVQTQVYVGLSKSNPEVPSVAEVQQAINVIKE